MGIAHGQSPGRHRTDTSVANKCTGPMGSLGLGRWVLLGSADGFSWARPISSRLVWESGGRVAQTTRNVEATGSPNPPGIMHLPAGLVNGKSARVAAT